MLEIAFQNERQHRQIQHGAGGPLILMRRDRGASIWQAALDSTAIEADAVVEISFDANGIALSAAGCEVKEQGDRISNSTIDQRATLPVRFVIGDTWLEIVDVSRSSGAPSRALDRLHGADHDSSKTGAATNRAAAGLSSETLAHWFAILGGLNRWSSCLQELFVQAARSAVESIGLDGAMVLRRRDGAWEIAASYLPRPELGIMCDPTALGELVKTPETLFHGFADATDEVTPDSQTNLPAVVISPLRDASGAIAGAIYGYRSVREGNARRGIRRLEANLIELLANAVSEGMLRIEQEAAIDRRRILLEQAFAAGGLQNAGQLLSEQREVTLLFADLRDFTKLTTSLESEQVFELLSHVMDSLTAAVLEHDGLVIDYFGDGLTAMWNAPADQAEHAELACRAALRMLKRLPVVASDWAELLGSELRLGIGIHTGNVQVGNAGSAQQIKYGPRGANVHVTSRVEAASKVVGVPLLLTQQTASRLSNRLVTYRVCRAGLAGIHRPVDLYGVFAGAAVAEEGIRFYENALAHFEEGRYEQAALALDKIGASPFMPVDFLRNQIDREIGRQSNRRCTDKSSRQPDGVIKLCVK